MTWLASPRNQMHVAVARRAIARRAQTVTIERLSGVAPNVTSVSATVIASVTEVKAAPGFTDLDGKVPRGNVPQSRFEIVLLAPDLEAASFPMPPAKFDRVTLSSTGTKLTVDEVDAHKGAVGGLIYLCATGVGS